MAHSSLTFRQFAATVCGLIVMVTPLALWVAWSPAILVAVLAACVLAGALCVVLAEDPPPRTADRRHIPLHPAGKAPPDGFLAELVNAGPWMHHRRLSATAAFRRKMDRLRQLRGDDRGE